MLRQDAINEIRSNWRSFYPGSKDKKGIICPLCGHGKNGDGIIVNSKSEKAHSLICFGGCNFRGDILDLIQQDRGLDFSSALEYAADFLNITIDNKPGEQQNKALEQKATQETVFVMPKLNFTEYYSKCAEAIKEAKAISYLQARGISQETAERFNIGYDATWISPTALLKYKEGINKNKPYPSARIIVPMTKNHYLARAIDPSNSMPKMNETGGGSIEFFNYEAIKDAAEPIFIVEGAFDALSIIEVGANAIALNSTSNADKFINALKLETDPIKAAFVICLDNDGKPGTANAVNKLKSGLNELELNYIVGDITGSCKDANEALTENKAAFVAAVEKAKEQAQGGVKETYIQEFLNKIQTEAYKPYKTGVNFFDDLLGGGVIKQSILLLLAAPGTGKTTLCQQIAEAMAANKKKVVYFNLEMSREQMLAKSISNRLAHQGKFYTAVDILQGYAWTDKQRQEITAAIKEYNTDIYPYLRYNPSGTSADLETLLQYINKIGAAAKEKNEDAPVIVLDYLHLLTTDKGLDNQELIKQAIIGLKKYALDYDSFVIAISATGREANKKQMTMNSGRDSSNLEYTGDYMLGLNYAAVFNSKTELDAAALTAEQLKEPREMMLQVLKARLGKQGTATKLFYDAAHNFFYQENEFAPSCSSAFTDPRFTERPKKKRY